LARRFAGANRHLVTARGQAPGDCDVEPPVPSGDADDLEGWARFHEEWERLRAEEREVVGLIFYHGWKQADVADLFQISVRTVQRPWDSALVKLQGRLRDEMPGP
jgi:DNA-directed RNA polymerase specialized sigma24 family protein